MPADDLASIFADLDAPEPKNGNGGGFTVDDLRKVVESGHIDPERSLPAQGDSLRLWARFVVRLDKLEREYRVSEKFDVLEPLHENAMELITAALDEAEREWLAERTGTDQAASVFIDWPMFWNREDGDVEWAYKDVLAKGRGHAIYATHKAGKSLFLLYVAASMVVRHEDCVVVCLDYEMSEADLHERLDDMGYGPETDFSRLRYALLPTLPPLDTRQGADALMGLLDGVEAEFPGRHVIVTIDTISRAVCGEENSADTFRAFYSHTGIALKRRGCTWVRLDHGGKTSDKGQRGSSSKGDDVDVVWKLQPTENGISLKRELSRMSWVPEQVAFLMTKEFPLRYLPAQRDYAPGTRETADLLARLEVPVTTTVRAARDALHKAGVGRKTTVIGDAVRMRKEEVAEGFRARRETRGNSGPGSSTEAKTGDHGKQDLLSLGNDSGNTEQQTDGHSGKQSPPLGGGHVPSPRCDDSDEFGF